MGASVFKVNATGAAGLAATATVPAGRHYRLVSVTIALDAAPVTSESMTITLDANAGAAYDLLLDSQDLQGVTDYVYSPSNQGIALEGGDAIDVAYTNTDTNTYGLQITLEAI